VTVSLLNTTHRLVVLLLAHDPCCVATGRCSCSMRLDGIRLPAAVTLPAGQPVRGLSDEVLELPEVAAALRAGALRALPEEPVALPMFAPPEDDEPEPSAT